LIALTIEHYKPDVVVEIPRNALPLCEIVSRKGRKGLAKDAKDGVLFCGLGVSLAPFAGNFRRKGSKKTIHVFKTIHYQSINARIHVKRQTMVYKINTEEKYGQVMEEIAVYLQQATSGGGFQSLAPEDRDSLQRLSHIAEAWEDGIPLMPIKP